MAQTVLGLDIGSYSIKAAIFEMSFKTFQITDLYESRPLRTDDMSKEEALEATREALRRFLQENQIPQDLVIAALSGAKVSHRNMKLPFKDLKQIEKILPFELESFLPFAMEDLVVDFDLTDGGKDGSNVIAFAAQKSYLGSFLSLFDSGPRIVDIDALALGNVAHVSSAAADRTVAIIDIGHQKTSICINDRGKTVAVRTLLTGGKAITDLLRVDLDLTYQQAEQVKHKYGLVSLETKPLKDSKQRRISRVITKIFDSMIIDVMQTIHNYEAAAPEGRKVDGLLLCGGSSLIRDIDRYFKESTDRETGFVQCKLGETPLTNKIGKKELSMIQAIGLGIRMGVRGVPANRLSRVNMRKGEFALSRSYAGLGEKLKGYGVWAAVIGVLLVVQFAVNYMSLSGQLKSIEKQVISSMRTIMPDVPAKRLKSGKKSLQIMQGRIADYQAKVDLLTSGLKSITALGILREISSTIPEEIKIDVKEISIDRNKVFMKGDTDSFTSVDKIVTRLRDFEGFSKVDKGAISDSPSGDKKRFTISIVVGDSKTDGQARR